MFLIITVMTMITIMTSLDAELKADMRGEDFIQAADFRMVVGEDITDETRFLFYELEDA